MPENIKKLLLVSARFPPDEGIGVRRAESFAKFLPEFGWRPYIVTSGCLEKSSSENPMVFRRYLRHFGNRSGGRFKKFETVCRCLLESPHSLLATEYDRRFRRHRSDLFPLELWYHRHELLAQIRAMDFRFDAILATAPSNSPLRLGSWLSEKLSLPWVADLRDNLVALNGGDEAGISQRLEREKEYTKSACRVVTVSKGCAREIGRRLGREVYVLSNGFDGVLADSTELLAGPVVIRYTGKLRRGRMQDHSVFFQGLESLDAEEPSMRQRLRVEFYGPRDSGRVLLDLLQDFPNARFYCHFMGSVSWEQCLELQENSTALLLFSQPDSSGIMTGKVFEYMRAMRPILVCPGDGGELDDLVIRCGLGLPSHSVSTVRNTLRTLIEDGGARLVNPDKEYICRFSRRELTRRLAEILDNLVCSQ